MGALASALRSGFKGDEVLHGQDVQTHPKSSSGLPDHNTWRSQSLRTPHRVKDKLTAEGLTIKHEGSIKAGHS